MSSASNNSLFSGTGVAVVTPFNEKHEIDFPSLTKIIEHIISGNCEYLVVMGTTGESPVLSKEEKKQVLEHALKTVNKRIPVVYGIGGNNTSEVVAQLEAFNPEGVSGILSVSPYYNKPNQRGIYAHYKAVAEASPLPVILYNVPGRTGSNVTADTTLRLAHDFPKIAAVKEASGNFEQIMSVIKGKPENFTVISGDDLITMPLITAGADGVISVVANAFPKDFSEMVRLARAQKNTDAQKLHYKLMRITQLMFSDGNPGGVKATLEALGLCKNILRLPNFPVNDTLREEIVAEVKKLGK